jgi:hypothetical protein
MRKNRAHTPPEILRKRSEERRGRKRETSGKRGVRRGRRI